MSAQAGQLTRGQRPCNDQCARKGAPWSCFILPFPLSGPSWEKKGGDLAPPARRVEKPVTKNPRVLKRNELARIGFLPCQCQLFMTFRVPQAPSDRLERFAPATRLSNRRLGQNWETAQSRVC